MRFEWDEAKARSNIAKHGVSFDLACKIWDDRHAELLRDTASNDEERWIAIGVVGFVTLLVVHSYPERTEEDKIRLISAREATQHERRRYEQ